ncbi:MAG: hypothetical protein ACUZ8H_15950 [Candidatus Anammoxibacter sp.]
MKGFKIIKHKDIEKDLEKYHRLGAKEGVYLGFKSMEEFYSMRSDGVTDWTGFPQSGKTEMLLECLFNTSILYGWKHLMFVPDIGDEIEVMAILIHKYTGMTFDKKYPNRIDIASVWKASAWLLEHFHILKKTDPMATISPKEFWNYAIEYKKEHGIQTATIDSWKDMRHDYHLYGGTYAQYLSNVLPYRNMLSEVHDIHFHTIIHPKTPRRMDGKIQHPDVDDMEGGAQWNNSGKTIISVHRENKDTTLADIKMLKVKPRIVGKWGFFAINFDPTLSRYYDINPENGGIREFAKKKESNSIKPK